MVLPVEYFKTKTHIIDLQKLKDSELFFIIRLFYDELENFNKSELFQLKGLIIACDKMKDLIKDLRFIISGYKDVTNEENITLYSDIKDLLIQMDKIEIELKKIKAVRQLKKTVNDLVGSCLLNIRLFYTSLSGFICNENILFENHLWKDYYITSN